MEKVKKDLGLVGGGGGGGVLVVWVGGGWLVGVFVGVWVWGQKKKNSKRGVPMHLSS